MKINGKTAISGTVLVKPPEQAEITTPFGEATLVFNPSVPDSLSYNHQFKTFNFGGFTNNIGTYADIAVIMQNQTRYSVKFAVYAFGDGADPARLVHYTIC